MSAPSVSVPQIIFSRPFCASCSTKMRYFGNRPAVAQTNVVAQPAFHVFPVMAVEFQQLKVRGERSLSLSQADAQVHQSLSYLRRGALRKMHQVDPARDSSQATLPAFPEGRLRIFKTKRHRTAVRLLRTVMHSNCPRPCQPRVRSFSKNSVKLQRRGHQKKARFRKREQRDLRDVVALRHRSNSKTRP